MAAPDSGGLTVNFGEWNRSLSLSSWAAATYTLGSPDLKQEANYVRTIRFSSDLVHRGSIAFIFVHDVSQATRSHFAGRELDDLACHQRLRPFSSYQHGSW
jgi:hypothetical protein